MTNDEPQTYSQILTGLRERNPHLSADILENTARTLAGSAPAQNLPAESPQRIATERYAALLRLGHAHGPTPAPTGLSPMEQDLHDRATARAKRDKIPWREALNKIAPDPTRYGSGTANLDDAGRPVITPADDDRSNSAIAHHFAVMLMDTLPASYRDATIIHEALLPAIEAHADTGEAPEEWKDSRPRPTGPKPYDNDLEWERDRRRAAAAGVGHEINRDYWQAAAEEGRDIVGELADQARAQRRQQADQALERAVASAREQELDARKKILQDRAARIAKQQIGQPPR